MEALAEELPTADADAVVPASRFEWALVCLAHNALKLFRALLEPLGPTPGARLRALLGGLEVVGAPACASGFHCD